MAKIPLISPYGFVYITTNLINGKRYIGRKIFDSKNNWVDYIGSGAYFQKAVKKYGKENFSRNIIDIAYSNDELNNKEIEYIRFFNATESPDFYNIESGGQKYPLSEHTKKLISENHANLAGENHPMYGKHHTEETKRKISEVQKGKIPVNKGKPMSQEQKEKLKEAWKHRELKVSHHRIVKCLESGKVYNSIQDASDDTGIKYSSIVAVLSGRRNQVFKNHFVYVE